MRSGTRLTLTLVLGLALAACESVGRPQSPEIRLSFEGSVTSVADGAPISGVVVNWVTCGLGCQTKETTLTDAAGRYALTVRHRCVLGTDPIFFAHLEVRFGVRSASEGAVCTTATQTIAFAI